MDFLKDLEETLGVERLPDWDEDVLKDGKGAKYHQNPEEGKRIRKRSFQEKYI